MADFNLNINAGLKVTMTGHSFVVGDVIRRTTGSWAKAQADSAANAEVYGVVGAVADANNFTVFLPGHRVTGLTGLTDGDVYYLSAATAGLLTNTPPSTAGQVEKPVAIADSTTSLLIVSMRGNVVGGVDGLKVYEAALTQTGTGAPVAVIFQNTTGRTVTWTREDVGTYIGRFSSPVTSSNSGCSLGAPLCVDAQVNPTWAYPLISDYTIAIITGSIAADGATEVTSLTSDDILDKTILRIIIP